MAQKFNQPVSGLVTPRFGGIATFMRLPHVPLDEAAGIDIDWSAFRGMAEPPTARARSTVRGRC